MYFKRIKNKRKLFFFYYFYSTVLHWYQYKYNILHLFNMFLYRFHPLSNNLIDTKYNYHLDKYCNNQHYKL